MEHKIEYLDASSHIEVVDVWEASVRATHHFLNEEGLQYFKPLLLNTYLHEVELKGIKGASGQIIGFIGVNSGNLEMLFIHPDHRGQHVGRVLLEHAINELDVTKVDVNEQNEQAVGFYHHCGFETVAKSELDASGKPYPTLHMELKKS